MRNPDRFRLTAECEDLAVRTYLLTRSFPRDERFGLTSQIRRGAVSIGSNFVEGCGRQGDRAFLPFLYNSMGSSNEVQFQLGVALRLDFGVAAELGALREETAGVGKQIASLITSIEKDLGRRPFG